MTTHEPFTEPKVPALQGRPEHYRTRATKITTIALSINQWADRLLREFDVDEDEILCGICLARMGRQAGLGVTNSCDSRCIHGHDPKR
ncbi:hypothetical protein SIID45300_01045 [Candidatus Magnetaquicoccaceae bacterium FCR-1]|uniref:Uncharacterized protein n=1 Tax=Candidatus Magnetaquiglobus chichijimensis TaxID=3141448 RepID=A0ABQ0C767_9PROT